jgi:hypothetical protein
VFVARFVGRDAAEHQPGVVDQAVEAPKSRRRLGDDALALGPARDVALDG